MDNAVQAIMMAFGIFVLVIALSLAVFMFSQVTAISERLLYFADKTNYYETVEIDENKRKNELEDIKTNRARYVDIDTIIPTLYRYYKENFCVKIYDARNPEEGNKLIQIFDVDLENNVEKAIRDNDAASYSTERDKKEHYALKTVYNDSRKQYYMFGVPWTGSAEKRKKRVDYFINGSAGYIEETYVDYSDPNKYPFANAIKNDSVKFTENFISYMYSGDTFVTEDGDELVTVTAKDKIVIIYTMVNK